MSDDRLHNQPPEPLAEQTFAELMLEESGKHRARADELVKALAAEAVPETEEDAARVTAVANLASAHRKEMDEHRIQLKRPYDEQAADVQRAWQPWIKDLEDQITRARGLMDERRRRLERATDEIRRQAAEKAAAETRRAEEAALAAQEAEVQGDASEALKRELEAIQAWERAERMMAVDTPAPQGQVRTQVGMASQTSRSEGVIVDLNKTIRWLLKHKREQFIQLISQLVKEAVRGKVTPDGVEVRSVSATRFSR